MTIASSHSYRHDIIHNSHNISTSWSIMIDNKLPRLSSRWLCSPYSCNELSTHLEVIVVSWTSDILLKVAHEKVPNTNCIPLKGLFVAILRPVHTCPNSSQVTWGQSVQYQSLRPWKSGLATSNRSHVPSPKSQVWHGRLHGNNTFWS